MERLPFADYLEWPQLNASLLVHAFKSWKQLNHVRRLGYQPKTDTRVGTALHSMVELLPVERFEDTFCIMPDYKLSPDNVTGTGKASTSRTAWVKEQEAAFQSENEGREVLSVSQHKRCLRMLSAIQSNERAMELIDGSIKEASVTADLDGVPCKGRMDGLKPNILWDLKSTRDVAPHAFGKTAANLRYVWKLSFYWRLLAANDQQRDELYLIAVQDSVPMGDGSFNEAADCAVYSVPLIAIENQLGLLEQHLIGFKHCLETNWWPGVPDGDLFIPNWSMNEMELVD